MTNVAYHRNQSIDLLWKTIDWFVNDRDVGFCWVTCIIRVEEADLVSLLNSVFKKLFCITQFYGEERHSATLFNS